jgi:CubicO group peptidase (beta-lactamase class C family)
MTSSSYLWNAMVDARAAQPYGAVAPIPGPRFTAQAAASLEASLEDFIRFARASMSSERPEFATTVLPPATVRAMQQPVAPSNDYGLGYSVPAVNRVRALGHGGSNAGWQAQFLVIPATGDGIILMTNASLGHEILNQVLCGWLRAAMGETRRCVKGIGAGRLADAIAVFELNVEAYPEGYNAYDSLGEALLARGDTVSAVRNYEKSVQLNAQNQNGIDVLKRIKGPPE